MSNKIKIRKKLKFLEIDQESAILFARRLKGHWTKNRLSFAIKNIKLCSNNVLIPLGLFFDEQFFNDTDNFYKDKFGKAVGICMERTGKPGQWAIKRIMHDVLNGFIVLLRENNDRDKT